MSNLLVRARSLLSAKPVLVGTLVLLPLAAATPKAQATSPTVVFTVVPTSGFYLPGSGPAIPDPNAQLSGTGNNPITLFTLTPITITSATYTGNLAKAYVLDWTGALDPTFFPVGSTFSESYDFTITLSSGAVNWFFIGNDSGLNASGVASGPSTHVTGSTSEVLTAVPTSPLWHTNLILQWTGFTGPSTMTISVPNSTSIDLSVVPAPEPASLALLTLGTATLLTRRRRNA